MGLGGVRNHMKNNERGLTLIEVLAATVILSIVLTAFITVSNYTMASRSTSDKKTEALRLAEDVINKYRSTYANPSTGNLTVTSSTINTINVIADPAPESTTDYRIKIQHSKVESKTNTSASYSLNNLKTNYVSLQSIVTAKNTTDNTVTPRLLTVTVSWDG
jgi:prepilin-type N-terminal cleavage/methylation domain-containing protein